VIILLLPVWQVHSLNAEKDTAVNVVDESDKTDTQTTDLVKALEDEVESLAKQVNTYKLAVAEYEDKIQVSASHESN